MLIRAVLFDLDDTLYPQESWLAGAWRAVADVAPDGVAADDLHRALVAVAAEGSDRGRIIDRALACVGAPRAAVEPLVHAFRAHAPSALECYPGTRDALAALRQRVPIALVTDGDPRIQRNKLAALGLRDAFDAVVFSDELGRLRRKPHPAPFVAAASALGVPPSACLNVGDRPAKDVVGAAAAGLLGAVRVRTGEYADDEDVPGSMASVPDVTAAAAWIAANLDMDASSGVHSPAN